MTLQLAGEDYNVALNNSYSMGTNVLFDAIPQEQRWEVLGKLRREVDPCSSRANNSLRGMLMHLNDEHAISPEQVAPYLADLKVSHATMEKVRKEVRRIHDGITKNEENLQAKLVQKAGQSVTAMQVKLVGGPSDGALVPVDYMPYELHVSVPQELPPAKKIEDGYPVTLMPPIRVAVYRRHHTEQFTYEFVGILDYQT